MADLHNIVITRVVTEKQSAGYAAHREEIFKVAPNATKPQIKAAVEQLFDVRVKGVRTLVQPAKRRTMGKTAGRRPKWKKAYVRLHPDDTIEGMEG